jgi:hypothetical protein
MYACFDHDIAADKLDRDAFKFHHKLTTHPALTLDNLARVLPALPKERVMYSTKRLSANADFEATFRKRPQDCSIEETLESIRTSDSYIMVSSPEVDRSFAPLYKELLGDVERVMKARGVGEIARHAKLFLFIASPNSVTPFHIDRYSTFLMQFRGSKEVSVFPQWDERIVSAANQEAYVANVSTKLPYSKEMDKFGTRFQFAPGEALHIPFIAGHHVKNGADDVSISMSIIFNTEQSLAWRNALMFNHVSRKLQKVIGMAPTPVGHSGWRDAAKAKLWPATSRAIQLVRA